jgi:hypothetical protein
MRRLSTFVQTPALPSLEAGIPILAQGELFSTYALKLDSELFPLLLEAKPCLLLLSLSDSATTASVTQFLTDFRTYRLANGGLARDPACRIVLVADSRVPRTSWSKLGAYEVMIAPVQPHVLAFKLARHYHKALAVKDEPRKLVLQEEIEISAPSASNEWKISLSGSSGHHSDPQKQTFHSSHTHAQVQKISVRATLPGFNPDIGAWKKKENADDDLEEVWEWKNKVEHSDPEKREDWSFTGEMPVYDSKDKTWTMTVDSPRMMRGFREGKQSESYL